MPKYKKLTKNIQQVTLDNGNHDGDITWINITNPGKKEIEFLRKKYKFELRHLQASSAKAKAERSIVNKDNQYLFMIIQFPIFNDKKIIASEIDFFIGHGFLITMHKGDVNALNEFFKRFKKDGDSFLAYKLESSAILLYEILDHLTLSRYNLLDENSKEIYKVDRDIFDEHQKTMAYEILLLKRNIITIRKIIKNHKNVFKKLVEMESSLVPAKQIRKYYNVLIENSKRVWEMTDNQKEMIEALQDTNESILNYRISDIMKTLTIFSVIVFPLTLLAAIFGMNTVEGMPFMNNPNGFWIVIGMMFVGCLGMLLFFERKKWL